MPRLEATILSDGTVLAPVRNDDGGWRVVEVPVGAQDHAQWVVIAQEVQRVETRRAVSAGLWRFWWQQLLLWIVLAAAVAIILKAEGKI